MSSPESPGPQEPTGLSKGAQISIGALAVAALLGWYSYTNLETGSSFTYYQTLEEFRAAAPPTGEAGLRVHGYVATASIERDLGARQVRFEVQNDPPHASPGKPGDARLTVVYRSLETPDLFKDGAEVVVEGRLEGSTGETIFVADNVMAKCPSKFQAEAAGEGAVARAEAEAL
jgi:cytochrome c-type biogenesis protein CcmE